MPALAERLRRAWRACRQRPQPRRWARAIAFLERCDTLTAAEAHALRAGNRLGDLYSELSHFEVGVDWRDLDEIRALIGAGDLPEAIVQLGRLHPDLADLPRLFDRSAARARA